MIDSIAFLAGGTLTLAAVNEEAGPNHQAELSPGDYVRLSVSDTGLLLCNFPTR